MVNAWRRCKPEPGGAGRGKLVGVECELLIYGATAAGVMAAVAAARRGTQTVLIEPGRHIGGMTSGGLGYTDVGDRRVIGGLALAFQQACANHYGVPLWTFAGPEPHVAEGILSGWLAEAGVDVVTECALEDVRKVDARITEVAAGGRRFRPGVCVDAGYEGDLMAAAGVDSAAGRESRQLYGERFAGRREYAPGRHNFPPYLDPFAATGELLPLIRDEPLAEIGSGDGAVMAYGYRVCLTTASDRLPFAERRGYDPGQWEIGRRYIRELVRSGLPVRAGDFLGLEPNLPHGKCDGNSLGPISLNLLDGSNIGYPTAGAAERNRIVHRHREYTLDFLWFLSHDPAVPAAVRAELNRWGWPRDEFSDTDGLPHQLYVREGRRMRGEAVLTEHDLLPAGQPFEDSIGMGSYHIDIREVQRTWMPVYEHPQPIPMVFNEGYLSVPVPAYRIPYRVLLPRREQCRNLVVPVCVSASHVAFASLRMEPQYQILGQAAGTAAAIALSRGLDVAEIPIGHLQQALRRDGQVLSL